VPAIVNKCYNTLGFPSEYANMNLTWHMSVHHCFLVRPNPGGWIVQSWTKLQLITEAKLQSSHRWEMMSTGSMSDHRGVCNVSRCWGGWTWGNKWQQLMIKQLFNCTYPVNQITQCKVCQEVHHSIKELAN